MKVRVSLTVYTCSLFLCEISHEKFIRFWGENFDEQKRDGKMIDHEKYIFSEFVLDLVVSDFFFFLVADFIQLQTRKEFCSQGCDGAVHLV